MLQCSQSSESHNGVHFADIQVMCFEIVDSAFAPLVWLPIFYEPFFSNAKCYYIRDCGHFSRAVHCHDVCIDRDYRKKLAGCNDYVSFTQSAPVSKVQ